MLGLKSLFHDATGKCIPEELCRNKKRDAIAMQGTALWRIWENISTCLLNRDTINTFHVWSFWRCRAYAFMHAHTACLLVSVSFHSSVSVSSIAVCLFFFLFPLSRYLIVEGGDRQEIWGQWRRKGTFDFWHELQVIPESGIYLQS